MNKGILLSFTQHHVVPNLFDLLSSVDKILKKNVFVHKMKVNGEQNNFFNDHLMTKMLFLDELSL